MYTVIITDKNTSEVLRDYKFLFKPFIDKGDVAFCDWNKSGTDVVSAVPDLYSLISGKTDWRAVVVDTESIYGYNSVAPKKNNPFDYSEFDSNPVPHESDIPIIRLSHILGGYNLSIMKDFEKGFEYYDAQSGKKVRVKESNLTSEELNNLKESYDDVVPVFIEKEITDDVKKKHKQVSEKYYFSDTRPVEIDLIVTRKKFDYNEKAVIEESWKNHLEMSSSNFWEINHYPNNCRFLVYDITNQDNSLYRREMTEFWLAVLTFAINKVSASTLQAYRIYKISIDISKDNMQNTLNEHMNRLNSVYGYIKEQINLRPECSFDEDEEIVPLQEVPVTIEKNDSKSLYIPLRQLGFFRDVPCDETGFWDSQVRQKRIKLNKFLKMPRRSIDKAANYVKKKTQSFRGDSYILDHFQVSDLMEFMKKLEYEIVMTEVKQVVDKKNIYKSIDDIDRDVKREISYRMNRKTAVISAALILFICFIGCSPYLIYTAKANHAAFVSALGITALIMLATLAGGGAALVFQRFHIVKLMNRFNDLMRRISGSVHEYTKMYEKYFSEICTYMKAVSIYEGATKKNSRLFSMPNIFLMHKKAITAMMQKDEDLMIAYDIKRIDEMVTNITTFFDINQLPRDNALYYFSCNYEEKDIPINSTGDMVTAPYKFVSKLKIEREDIYDEEE